MIFQLFNRTFIIWAAALMTVLVLVHPKAALMQRLNTLNGASVDCVINGNCQSKKAITETRIYYTILAQLYPDYGRGWEMQGICYLASNNDSMAIKKFNEALEHNPDLFWVSYELGKAYYRQGKYAQGLACFQSIINQANEVLIKKAVLSNLRQMSDNQRSLMIRMLPNFVNELKEESYQLMTVILLRQENSPLGFSKPVIHPWGYVITPMKELLFQ